MSWHLHAMDDIFVKRSHCFLSHSSAHSFQHSHPVPPSCLSPVHLVLRSRSPFSFSVLVLRSRSPFSFSVLVLRSRSPFSFSVLVLRSRSPFSFSVSNTTRELCMLLSDQSVRWKQPLYHNLHRIMIEQLGLFMDCLEIISGVIGSNFLAELFSL